MRIHFLIVLLAIFSSLNLYSDNSHLDIRFPVEKWKMDNGLTVILYKDNTAPLVSYHTWFRVGSKDETWGQTGLAHLFEHMMFKGSKNFPGNSFETILLKNGITNNAFTSRDYTGYFENLPSTKLETVMAVEADRMRNLNINAETLKKEIEVVKEERRMRVDNNPSGQMYERLVASMFKVHPYRWPVLGSMKDLNALSVKDCQDFYNRFYSPSNAVLVIGGDIEIAEAKKLVNKYYGGIEDFKTDKRINKPEPKQTSPRASKIALDVAAPRLGLAYRGAKAGSEDSYALDILASVLGEGASSRLYQDLIYKRQAVTSVYAFHSSMIEDGMFAFFANLKPGVSVSKIQKHLENHVKSIQNNGITERELQKAINQIQSGYVRSLQTISSKVRALALNEILLGDHEYLFSDLEKYSKVTAEQVKAVAKKYLGKNQQVKVEGTPKKGKR